jgi:hypothetical protein
MPPELTCDWFLMLSWRSRIQVYFWGPIPGWIVFYLILDIWRELHYKKEE